MSKVKKKRVTQSLPVWGVWIEIVKYHSRVIKDIVAPRMGSVD